MIAEHIETVDRKLSELQPAGYNPRRLTEAQHSAIRQSLKEFGAVTPLVINMHPDRKNIIIGGHQRQRIAMEMGWETFPCVEVSLTEEKEKELNIRLNKNTGEFDWDLLANNFDVGELREWGFSDEELFGDAFDDPNATAGKYTGKIETPVYEPSGDLPLVEELYDASKANDLLDRIDKADVPEDVKKFLRAGAMRHVEFNFKKIGDFYAEQEQLTQELMEEQALVIIDFDKAIENGYVEMSVTMREVVGEEEAERNDT